MRFAILGDDPQIIPLARAVVNSGHALSWLGETDGMTVPLQKLAPNAQIGTDWEALLDGDRAEVVIVGRARDRQLREEPLRRIAQASVPLLVVHPVCDSLVVFYELDMIRTETRGILQPYVRGLEHPALAQIAESIRYGAGGVGPVEQVEFERPLADRSKRAVLEQFSCDAQLIQRIAGQPVKLGVLGTSNEDAAYGNLSVQMATSNGLPVHWAVRPSQAERVATITLYGTSGCTRLHMPEEPGEWGVSHDIAPDQGARGQSVPTPLTSAQLEETFSDWDDATAAIHQIVSAVEQHTCSENWLYAARSIEMAETIPRSLRRGKTVDLNFEDSSEVSNFKGTMATVGCGLLVAAPLVLLIVALGDAADLPFLRFWYRPLLVVLVAYLLLQLLPKLVLNEAPQSARDEPVQPPGPKVKASEGVSTR